MSAKPKYYWLKLKNTYFSQLEQKKMRKQENGVYMQIIYLKMMLHSINNDGCIYYQGVYDSLEEELAEEFLEDIEMIRYTIQYLLKNDMISLDDNFNCTIPEAVECTGSECESASRMRKKRERDKAKKSQCDNYVTKCDISVTECDTEIEKDKELDKEIDKDICADAPKRTRSQFKPPTLEEVQVYCRERNNKVDAERFIDYYSSNGWMVGKNKMKNWKAAVRTWERNQYNNNTVPKNSKPTSGGNKSFKEIMMEMEQREQQEDIYVESKDVTERSSNEY